LRPRKEATNGSRFRDFLDLQARLSYLDRKAKYESFF
jgi:hypothetical protein